MIGYVTIGVRDMEKAKSFYTQLLAPLGAKELMSMDRIAFIGKSMSAPMLAVCVPFNEEPNHPGNGNMVALPAGSKEGVDEMYKKAIELGATCDGEPGQRIPNQFYGAYVKGGFMSHVAGKLFVRTGLPDVTVRIHNTFQGDTMNPAEVELEQIELAHVHVKSWATWLAAYRYRLEHGSYRAELAPSRAQANNGMNLHALLNQIEAEAGQDGLRAFFAEVCADTPQLRARLQGHGLLRQVRLDLDAKVAQHFPNATS